MDSHRRSAAYLTVVTVLATVLVGAAPPAQADPHDDAKQAQADVVRAESDLEDATARARLAARRLAETAAALPGAQRRVIDANGRVIAAQVEAGSARRRAAATQAEYDAAAQRFAAAQALASDAHGRLEDLAAESYKSSNLDNFNLVVGAGGALDALDALSYVDRVMNKQQDTIDQMTAARRAARSAQDAAGGAKRAADTARAEAEAALAAARTAEETARQAQADLLAMTNLRRDALALARSERAASLAKYAEAKAEERRIQDELRAWETRHGAAGPSLRPGARLLTPVHGWKSSNFGWRLNPVYGVWRLHAGIDLAAPGGSPIRAAADGTVIRAGWSGGYGKYTCISHGRQGGKGISTCYGHQSRIEVSPGQRVRRGQVIGRVGTTGASTGYHLHFEVRVNGDPRNPENWLPSCLC